MSRRSNYTRWWIRILGNSSALLAATTWDYKSIAKKVFPHTSLREIHMARGDWKIENPRILLSFVIKDAVCVYTFELSVWIGKCSKCSPGTHWVSASRRWAIRRDYNHCMNNEIKNTLPETLIVKFNSSLCRTRNCRKKKLYSMMTLIMVQGKGKRGKIEPRALNRTLTFTLSH